MENKKGVSTIIVTVILVALVLIAVGIVWAVVNNLMTGSTDTINYNEKCLGVNIQATAVDCTTPSACALTLKRTGTEDENITGVMMVFRNVSGDSTLKAIPVEGNIPALVSVRRTNVDSGIVAPNEVQITVYFTDDSGNERICPQTAPYTF
jgi:hypothetical protein